MTTHILLDVPTRSACMRSISPGDQVIDLTIMGPSAPLRRALQRDISDLSWHTTEVASDSSMRAARDAIIAWLANLPDMTLGDGDTLREVLRAREAGMYNFWWALPLTRRSLRLDHFPRAFMRALWLGEDAHREELAALLARDAGEVMIWSVKHESARGVAESLGVAAYAARSSEDGSRLEPMKRGDLVRGWRFMKGIQRATELSMMARSFEKHGSPQRADILIPTVRANWSGGSAPMERYIQDLPEVLERTGRRVVWLPMASNAGDLVELEAMITRHPVPSCWATREPLTEHIKQAHRLRKRVNACLPALRAHDALRVGGVDMSAWLIDELCELVDGESLRFMHLRARVHAAVARLEPSLVLYKDEFYMYGRTISAGAIEAPARWAYQHGLLTEDHWTYRYTREEWEGEEPLPTPDLFLGHGPYATECVTAHGAPRERVREIGSMRHDLMFARAAEVTDEEKRAAKRALGVREGLPLLVIFTQLRDYVQDWITRTVEGLKAAGVEAHLAIKQHPLHRDDERIQELLGELGWEDASIHAQDLDALLLAADVSLMENSTTGIEAAILGAPAICLRTPHRYVSFPYVEDGLALDAPNAEAMKDAVIKALDPAWRAQWEVRRDAFFARHMINRGRPAREVFLEMLDALDRA